MQKEVKNLRISIDGLAQLVRELKPKERFIVDIAMIPQSVGIDLSKFIKYFEESGYALINTKENGEEESKFNAFQSTGSLNKEIDKCYDSLILAKAWLGKVLGELGEETPYKNDGNRKNVEDIEPTADKHSMERILPTPIQYHYDNDYTHIQKVDLIRQKIANALQMPSGIENVDRTNSDRMLRILTFMSYFNKYMVEARFWLGFELERIREKETKNLKYGILKTKSNY